MSLLLALVIALPPLLLLLGLGLGVVAARWWWARRAAALAALQTTADEEAAAAEAVAVSVATAVPSSVALPPGRKASEIKLPRCIHVVASSVALQHGAIPAGIEAAPLASPCADAAAVLTQPGAATAAAEQAAADANGGRRAAAQHDSGPAPAAGCDQLLAAEEQLRSLVGGSMGGSGSLSPGGPLGHRKAAGSMDLGTLVRAGPSVISQVMEDWEARSTLYRLMSGMEQLGAPGSPVAAAGLLSPAAALFSPAPGSAVGAGGPPSMPPGEVHMDEIHLIECIGKGGYGCVYKASWRGAGVAVKYIKCPTDDSDSLGRAIREVVLSKKMSHPNVVQCYSWTVLTEPDAGRCIPSCSGNTSPREQSFTSRRGSSPRFKLFASRGSLELQRPGSAPQQGGSPGRLRLSGVRRGLDVRFNAAAGLLRGGGSPTSLHRITERLGQETEAGPEAGSARLGASTELIAELVAEAAEERGVQPSQLPRHSSAARSTQLLPHEDEPLAAGKPSPLKLMHVAAPTSSSPGSSPGIQAVHGSPHSTSSPAVVPASKDDGEASSMPSPGLHQEAVSLEPARLPDSPFAARAVQSQPLQHSTSGSSEAPGSRRRSSGSGAPQQQAGLPAGSIGAATHAVEQQQAAQQVAQQQQVQSQQSSEEDVYARFGSYDEMAANLRRLAAEGLQQDEPSRGEAAAEEQQAGRSLPGGGGPGGILPRSLNEQDFTVTAASSFSDVLSNNAFMLEGSSAELAVLSQPSSPRHQQQPRSGAGSWFLPSAASTRPATPRSAAGTTASAGLAGWQPQLLQQQLVQQQPSRFSRAASCAAAPGSSAAGDASLPHAVSLPLPAWPAAEQVPPAAADCDEQQMDAVQQRSSQDAPGGHTRRTRRCSSTVSLGGWHLPAESADPAEAEASSSGGGVQQPQRQPPQQQGAGEALSTSGSSTLPAAAAWAPGYIAAAAAASAPAKQQQRQQQQQPEPPRVSLGTCRSGAASGTVTPRACSLSNLGMVGAAADGSLQVTPRARSLRAAASQQVSPRADSVRSAGRSPGSAGVARLEELREEAAASADRLSLGSQEHSFNSEEGFGSPVKQRCGGVKDVFALEALQLSGQEALMVVVMEYCDLGSLRKALQRKAFRPSAKWPFQTTYRALLRTAQEIAKGMGYIHEFNIVHGDLKPGNVLLKTHKVDRRGYIAKVSDFGLSRPLDMEDMHTFVGSTLGTIAYSAPESFLHNKLKKPSDVYAFGIMLWEMFYCTEPYEGLLDGQICLGVSDGTLRPEFRDDCPEPYRRLAERCWHQDPERRPTFAEVDRELVRIEMEFRLHRHRAASKRASSAHSAGAAAASGGSQGGGSLPASRPGSPDVAPRAGGAAAAQAAAS